jgi:branched-chain amino acid transport system permease protein
MADTITQGIITGILMGIIYALIALGLSIVFGVMNVTNFAHGDFVMLSMYLSFVVGTTILWDAVFTPFITVPLLFLIGLGVYKVLLGGTIRQHWVVQLAVTVGIQILLRAGALIIWKAQPRALQYSIIQGNIQIGEFSILTSRLVGALVCLFFIIIVAFFLNKTWVGTAMRAASDDLDIASILGVNLQRIYSITFALGISVTAIAGGLLMSFSQVDPNTGMRYGLLSWCIIALAGLGSIPGLVVAGIIAGVSESVAVTFIDPRSRLLAIYLIFILVIWLKPKGLFGRK